MLATPDTPDSVVQAAQHDAHRLGVPLKVLKNDNPAIAALYPQCLTLIRPDQHVAWVGDTWPLAEQDDVLAMVTGQIP